MGLGRILVIGLFIWLCWFLYRRIKFTAISLKSQNDIKKTKATKKAHVSTVRQCAVCRVHVPDDEAVKQGDLYYCSDAHANENNHP